MYIFKTIGLYMFIIHFLPCLSKFEIHKPMTVKPYTIINMTILYLTINYKPMLTILLYTIGLLNSRSISWLTLGYTKYINLTIG